MKLPLLDQTGGDREDDVSYQKTQNWFPHITPESKSTTVLYPTPGLTLFATVGIGEIRGMIEFGKELYLVSNNQFYKVIGNGQKTLLGTLSTTTGRCTMAHNGSSNGKQIIIADGTQGYIYDATYGTFAILELKSSGTADTNTANKLEDSGATFTTDGVVAGMVVYNTTDSTQGVVSAVDSQTVLSIVDGAGTALDLFPDGNETYEVGEGDYPSTATHVAFMDSYFLANDPTNSGRFYISAGYQGWDWDSLDFATAERSPDELQALVVSNRHLILAGSKTTENWLNVGTNTDFPFEPQQSGFSQWGTIAPHSVLEIAGVVLSLSQNDEGVGQVIMSSGSNPQVVSTVGVAAEIAKLTELTDAYAWAYQHEQHTFYVLTFPTDARTFVYDLSTQKWHEWKTESTGYHRSTHHVYVFGKHLVGDPISGKVYQLDWSKYTDNGETIARVRRTAGVQMGDTAVRYYAVHADIKEGVGNSDVTNPQISLRWRDNNGAWSNRYSRSMGKQGEDQKRVVWRRLGRSYERVFEFRVTDPCNAVLIDAYGMVKQDAREMS